MCSYVFVSDAPAAPCTLHVLYPALSEPDIPVPVPPFYALQGSHIITCTLKSNGVNVQGAVIKHQ